MNNEELFSKSEEDDNKPQTPVELAAQKAARTGDIRDLREYLKARRNCR